MPLVKCRIQLLDNDSMEVEVDKNAKGQELLDKLCDQLNLLEKDYFSLTYLTKDDTHLWVNMEKKIGKQLKNSQYVFELRVKFYPPDPLALQEDITRYFLCLQIRSDIYSQRLPCSFVTHALLGSYSVQSDVGDYNPDTADGIEYLKDYHFYKSQTDELKEKIAELHKTHKGQTPAEADIHYLENAKKLAMYGLETHHALDSENIDIMIGVCCTGILIYRDKLRVNRFSWPKILKLSYKRNHFFIKIRPGEFDPAETTIGFKLPNHLMAKRLWKSAVEHHAFFRLKESEAGDKPNIFPRFGSKFRYSGRTQYQANKAAEETPKRSPPSFKREGKRMSQSMDGLSSYGRGNKGKPGDQYDRGDRKGDPNSIPMKTRSNDDLSKRDDDGKMRPKDRRAPTEEDHLNEKGPGYGGPGQYGPGGPGGRGMGPGGPGMGPGGRGMGPSSGNLNSGSPHGPDELDKSQSERGERLITKKDHPSFQHNKREEFDQDADDELSRAIMEAAGFDPNLTVADETIESIEITTNDKESTL